ASPELVTRIPAVLAAAGEWDRVHDAGAVAARARADAVRATRNTPLAIEGGGSVRVGAAGWTDPTLLAPGVFYPAGATTADARLRHYASRFSLVEIDATYYALPTRRMAQLWVERTPASFLFDVKAHAVMTGHTTDARLLPASIRAALSPRAATVPRLSATELGTELVDAIWTMFLDALEPLLTAGKLGAILLQFPPWLAPSRASAATIVAAHDRLRARGFMGAVELRHHGWFAPRVAARTLALLERHDIPYVMVDGPQGTNSSVPPVIAVTSPRLAVLRLHGRRSETWEARHLRATERYRYLYDREQLEMWVPRIIDVARQTQGVHVVHNNCHANYGTTNAAEIAEMLVEADTERRRMGREAHRAKLLRDENLVSNGY
ncbi:MAG: DUF72 domain-containing protein, partial [Gemmatimonadaceae bacterium]